MLNTFNLSHEKTRFVELRRRLLELDPDLDETTLLDTLDGATNLREAVIAMVRSALDDEAFARGLKIRIEEMNCRLSRFLTAGLSKRRAALEAMEAAELEKVTTPEFTAFLRTLPPSLEIVAGDLIPSEYWSPQPPKLDRKALLDRMNVGEAVPGVRLGNSKVTLSVRVK